MPNLRSQSGFTRFSVWKFRVLISIFFIAIASLGLFISKQAADQLQWESFHRFQSQAIELSERIKRSLKQIVEVENKRGFGEYSFAVAKGEVSNAFVQPSSLANLLQSPDLPGFVGYFQLDENNQFSTPILPVVRAQASVFGLSSLDISERENIQASLKRLLMQNGLLSQQAETPLIDKLAEEKLKQETQLRKSKLNPYLDEFNLDDSLRKKAIVKSKEKTGDKRSEKRNLASRPNPENEVSSRSLARVEKELLYEPENALAETAVIADVSTQKINILESRISDFSAFFLESGHLLFYRQVWQENTRYLQGFILEKNAFLDGLINSEFKETSLAGMSTLAVIWQGQVVQAFSASANYRESLPTSVRLGGAILHKQSLSALLGDWELVFTVEHLPAGAGAPVIFVSAASFLLFLFLGCVLIYRLLLKHLRIAQQQQNFVSSISHELKTPLTSIRMYGEMLKEGWVTEDKKSEYYNFIYHESERLTRLINNILQLARMTRSELTVDLKSCDVNELLDLIRSTIATQVERAGFVLELQASSTSAEVKVDTDLFLQAIINLVDNALKFSGKAEDKRIVIGFEVKKNELAIAVRDFGPGIEAQNIKKIFGLFYRAENELTRETKGTGIGLALVSELLDVMGAKIAVENCEPGAKFTLYFPLNNPGNFVGS